MSQTAKDLVGVLRGLQLIVEAGINLQRETFRTVWTSSSFKTARSNCTEKVSDLKKVSVTSTVSETVSRLNTVLAGIQELLKYKRPEGTRTCPEEVAKGSRKVPHPGTTLATSPSFEIKLTDSDKALLNKLDREHREKMSKPVQDDSSSMFIDAKEISNVSSEVGNENGREMCDVKAVPNPKSIQALNETSKQRKVPSSRISRMASFGTLAAGLGFGTIAEYTRQIFGVSNTPSNYFLSQANMERIVDTLCKVRGAALKLGQILSIQDEDIINPQLSKALERVRKSADFMPEWQLHGVLVSELGHNWRENFAEFDVKPFAAASIGEVHFGKTTDGKDVAVKIQYPGVAKGIESDIDNLFGVLRLWNVFPEGMFIDNLAKVAKRELAWEVDYHREAECTKKFRELLKPYPDYYVPEVIGNLTTTQVIATEILNGIPVDQCADLNETHRKFIACKILELILRELMEFRYMQTDPNWANFLYNAQTRKLMLLDFGASRDYSEEFVEKYVRIIKAASDSDRETVLVGSRDIGFLTGYESKIMEEAHVDAVMILGEIFRHPGEYDFTKHNTTHRLQKLVPTMISHRLCPPPEEIYSLHRKLSGIFMLCVKLKVSIPARDIFLQLYGKYCSSKM